MKRSLLWILTALLLVSCGGGDDGAGPGGGGNNNQNDPVPTAPGTPNGTATTQSIGASGGAVTSEDGLFTLTVPAGALASDTDITVQPITNTAWGGIGGGYRLTPDGLTFSTPVELTFQVAPEDLVGSAPDFVDVATQNDEGVWYVLKNRSYDDQTGTITATTTHFSDYVLLEGFQILPASASIGTLGTVNLSVKYCEQETVTGGDDDLVALVISCDGTMPPNTASNWSVNGIPGGNATVGTVVQTAAGKARYTAPASVPQNNPVAVSVDLTSTRGNGLLVSNITIGSQWYGTMTADWGNGEKAEAQVVWTQSATYENIELFEPSGTGKYTPDTHYDPPCWFVSFTPDTGDILPEMGQLFIDHSTNPAKFYGDGWFGLNATRCYSCEGWETPDCQEELSFPAFFAASAEDNFTTSADGQTISAQWGDFTVDPPTFYTVNLQRGSPPATFRVSALSR